MQTRTSGLTTTRHALCALILCSSIGWAGPAHADAVVHWNSVASAAIATATAAGRPAPATALDFAMVQAAVHDAVQSIERRYEPYYRYVPGASGSPDAAAARAAHDVLVHLFPTQTTSLAGSYDAFFTATGLAVDDPGVIVGRQAAANIIAVRFGDGRFPAGFPAFTGGTGVGQWRPTISYLPGPPPSGAAMAVPWLGSVAPWTLDDATQFRAEPPPALTSFHYAKDYAEVKKRGAFSSTARTAAETDLAYFYTDNFFVQWNRVLRAIADARITSVADSARLFALANIATADAIITAWHTKRFFNVWRPVTAIQEGHNDGNPLTVGDPTWRPLVNTPNYPDYTSGANVVTAAMTTSLRLFFATDKVTFDVTSNAPLAMQKTRTYRRFSDAARDVVDARVYLGLHFRSADTTARAQGTEVARWVFAHHLRSAGRPHEDDGDDHHR